MFEYRGTGYVVLLFDIVYVNAPAQVYGPPEYCYPDESEFSFESEVVWKEDDISFEDIENDLERNNKEIMLTYLREIDPF